MVIWIVTFLAMLALTLFIRYSRMGRACRACAEDLKMASLLGINTDRVIALTFVIGAAMAAVAGVLLGQLVTSFHLMDLNQLYTLIFCLWFLALGVVEYLVLRWVWRRWFSLAD